MDPVLSIVVLITSSLASKPYIMKHPVLSHYILNLIMNPFGKILGSKDGRN